MQYVMLLGLFAFLPYMKVTVCYAQADAVEKEFAFSQKLLEDRMYALAADQFTEFVKKHPNHELADDALFQAGESYFANEDYDIAFDSFMELEIRFPLSPILAKARHRLALCRLKSGKFGEAAELFKRIPLLHSEEDVAAQAWLQAGRAYRKNNDEQAALGAFLALVNDFPDSPERLDAYLEMVQIYVNRKTYDVALRRIDDIFRVYNHEPNDERVLYARASVLDKMGQQGGALSIYRTLVDKFPASPTSALAHYRLGKSYSSRKEYDKAIEHYDLCLANVDSAELLTQSLLAKGEVHLSQQEFEVALGLFQNAAANAEGALRLKVSFRMGKVLTLLKRYGEAIDEFEKIVAVGERDQTAPEAKDLIDRSYFLLKDGLIQLGRHQEALKLINAYLDDKEGRSNLAGMLFEKASHLERNINDYTRALRIYDEFMEIYPFHPLIDEAQLAIAGCYEQIREYGLALADYGHYLKRFPAGDRFKWVRNRIRKIRETVQTGSDNGLVRVTQLIANYSNFQNNGHLPLEIGRLYYDTKDFKSAVAQFKTILANPKNEDEKEEAYFLLGESYLKLADYFDLFGENSKTTAYRDSAGVVFKFLSDKQPRSKWADDAYVSSRKLALDVTDVSNDSLSELLAQKAEWQSRFPNGQGFDYLLLRIANHLIAGDTSQVRQAMNLYKIIQDNYATGDHGEEASYKECLAWASLSQDSTATAKLEVFSARYPDSPLRPQVLILQAELKLRAGNSAAAIQSLREIIADYFYSDYSEQANLRLADLHYEEGRFEAALDQYEAVRNQNRRAGGTNGTVVAQSRLLNEAHALEQIGRYSAALSKYITFLHDNPAHESASLARLSVARIARQQHNTIFAEAYYQGILNNSTELKYKYQAKIGLADIYFERNLFKEANAHYLSAIRLATDLAQEQYATAQTIRCKYKLRQFAAADADVKRFKKKFKDLETKTQEAQFWDDKGHAYITTKNFKQAEKSFKKLKDDFRDTEFSARGEFGLGEIYLITNKTEDALKILTGIPAKYPDSEITPLAYYNLGDFYYNSQQIANAVAAFQQVLAHPKGRDYHQRALLYLIRCSKDLKRWDQAIRLTRKYLNQYPNADDTFQRKIDLASFLKELNEFNRAIEHFTALKPYADNEKLAEIQFFIAESYEEMGNFQRAAVEFLKVKYTTKPTKLPWHVTAQVRTSDCFKRMGEITKARQILEKIIKERGRGDQFAIFAQKKLDELKAQDAGNPKDGS